MSLSDYNLQAQLSISQIVRDNNINNDPRKQTYHLGPVD